MNEKGYRILVIILLALLALGGAAGWFFGSRASRNATELGNELSAYSTLAHNYSIDLATITERYNRLAWRHTKLNDRYNDLAGQIPGFITGLGEVETGLGSLESKLAGATEGLRHDSGEVGDVAAEIREVIKAAQDLQDDDLVSGIDDSDTLDNDDTLGGVLGD